MPINGSNKDMVLNQLIEAIKRLVEVGHGGVLVGVKRRLNFVDTDTAIFTVEDNPTTKSVDISLEAAIVPGTVTDTSLRDSVGFSVIGRAISTTGSPADIVAGTDGLPLRRSSGALAFGSIPQTAVDSLTSTLAGLVPTTRTIGVTAPITGGGDLSANRTIAFDTSADLDNNARVKVYKNGTGVAIRRGVNFVEGTNITLTVTEDVPDESVDVTISASGGGSGLTHPQVMSRVFLR